MQHSMHHVMQHSMQHAMQQCMQHAMQQCMLHAMQHSMQHANATKHVTCHSAIHATYMRNNTLSVRAACAQDATRHPCSTHATHLQHADTYAPRMYMHVARTLTHTCTCSRTHAQGMHTHAQGMHAKGRHTHAHAQGTHMHMHTHAHACTRTRTRTRAHTIACCSLPYARPSSKNKATIATTSQSGRSRTTLCCGA